MNLYFAVTPLAPGSWARKKWKISIKSKFVNDLIGSSAKVPDAAVILFKTLSAATGTCGLIGLGSKCCRGSTNYSVRRDNCDFIIYGAVI